MTGTAGAAVIDDPAASPALARSVSTEVRLLKNAYIGIGARQIPVLGPVEQVRNVHRARHKPRRLPDPPEAKPLQTSFHSGVKNVGYQAPCFPSDGQPQGRAEQGIDDSL